MSNKEADKKQLSFLELFPDVQMNQSIKLELIEGMNTGLIGNDINLWLINNYSQTIQYPSDQGLSLYTFLDDKEKWIEISDKGIVISDTPMIIYPKSEENISESKLADNWLITRPIIQNKSIPIIIRIVVVGNIMRNGEITDERIGTYLDVTLLPGP